MAKEKHPVTPAIRELRDAKIQFEAMEYEYEEKGGTSQTALELNIDEHSVIKTLIFKADNNLICVLMHGDKEVSVKELARIINVKKIEQADEKTSMNATGYQFGGTSPFAHRKKMPTYAESTIFELPFIYINGGKRGFTRKLASEYLYTLLCPIKVKVAI